MSRTSPWPTLLTAAACLASLVAGGCWEDEGAGDYQVHPKSPLFDYGPETIIYYRIENGSPVEDRRLVFVYEEDRRLVAIRAGVGDSQLWDRDTYIYGEDGRLAEARTAFPLQDSTFTYDTSGRLVVEAYESMDGDSVAGVTGTEWHYSYDEHGRLAMKESVVYYEFEGPWEYPEWAPTSPSRSDRWLYAYDSQDRIQTEDWQHYDPDQGGWYTRFRDAYYYDDEARTVERVQESAESGGWVPGWRHAYSYDTSGRIGSATFSHYTDGLPVDWARSSYSYGANGRLDTIETFYYQNDRWELVAITEFTFTDEGNSLTFDGPWYPEPFADWVAAYYGAGDLNKYLW